MDMSGMMEQCMNMMGSGSVMGTVLLVLTVLSVLFVAALGALGVLGYRMLRRA